MCSGAALGVVRRRLVRVLAVGELEHPIERRDEGLREVVAPLEPARDRRLVCGRPRERNRGEPSAKLLRRLTVRAQLLEDDVVVRRTAHGRDGREVLRRGAQQRRPADVDHLDEPGLAQLGPVDGELERVEVHAHEVERLDAVLRERGAILRDVAPGEDPRVDPWVQRLHPPGEQLRELRDLLHAGHGEPRLLERGRRAAARDELAAELGEPTRERHEARLVVDGDQRAHSRVRLVGAACLALDEEPPTTRQQSVLGRVHALAQRLDGVALEHGNGLAGDHLTRVDAMVDEVNRRRGRAGPGSEHVLERMGARERRKRRRVHVHDALREALEEQRPEQLHVPGADDELDAVPLEPVRHGGVTRVSVVVARRAGTRPSATPPPPPAREHGRRERSTQRRRPEGRRRAAPAGSCPHRSPVPRSRAS